RLSKVGALLAQRFTVKLLTPATPADLADTVRREVDLGAVIALAGGDGTVSTALNAVDSPDLTIALIPCGTANDLARHLSIPLTLELAAERILRGVARPVDVLEVNGRRFCTVGALGLVADCAMTVTRATAKTRIARILARLLGSRVYHVSAIANILLRPD